MATAPVRAYSATPTAGWASTATPKTSPAFDVQAGDLLVLIAFSEDFTSPAGAPTWTGTGAWTLRQSVVVSAYCTAYLYTCAATATQAGRTVSMSRTGGGGQFSFYVTGWRNHGGLGVTGKANVNSGAPALTLATSANSAVVVGNSDWSANGSSWSWRTVNGSPLVETSRGGTAGATYMCYSGYSPDTGAAGNLTFGMLTPSTQKYSIVGAEILGTTATAPHYAWDAPFIVDVTGSGSLSLYFTWVAGAAPDVALTAAMVPAVDWDAPLTVDAILTGEMSPSFAWETTATLDVAITADTMPHFSWSASFGVDVALSSETSSDRAWSAAFTPDVELTAETAPHFTWDANLTADVGLEATTVPAFTWDAVFTPDVDLTATLTRARSWYHIFTADVNLAATTRPHFAWTSTATIEVSLTDQPQEPNMSVPSPDWGLVLMKWAGVYLDGTPCTGRIKVSFNKPAGLDAKAPMLDDDPETPLSIYAAATIDVQLTTKTVLYGGSPRPVGYAEFWVPATDDPDITDSAGNPLAGGTYTCTEALDRGAGQTPFKFVAPIATSPDGLWLNKIEHVA